MSWDWDSFLYNEKRLGIPGSRVVRTPWIAWGTGSIPGSGWGTKIPCASRWNQKTRKEKCLIKRTRP